MSRKLPSEFMKNMEELLNDDFYRYLDSFGEDTYKGLRINTLKINKIEFEKLFPSLVGHDVKWCEDGYYYNDNLKPTQSPFYNAGLFYIQEPSAMSPSSVMEIELGDKVLDLCSAPGGKATHLASKLKNSGLLIANDISASRCKALIKNIELMGIRSAVVTAERHDKLAKKFKNFFDKILVDAPCSGEGMFRRDERILSNWKPEDNDIYSEIQKDILNHADEMLDSDGTIVYSTCTFSIKENELVIENFLKNHENYYLEEINHEKFGFVKGFGDKIGNKELNKTARLLPYKLKGEGHFIAILRKKSNSRKMIKKYTYNEPDGIKPFNDFADKHFNIDFNGNFVFHKNSLFITNDILPDLSGIRVMKSGFYLGDIKNERFTPSQALASSLSKEHVKNYLRLELDDPRVLKYLKGETIEVDCSNGYVLVGILDYPLGFGIVRDKKLKNKYSKSFIIM